jgi:HD-like signal output (HDOD) protein
MPLALNMSKIDSALEGFTIPPRPDMLQQVQNEVEKDEPDLKAISKAINQDVGIAGFTLKVVNSPLFSLPRKISTIEHACMFLGLTRLIKLVNSIVLRFTLSAGDEAIFTEKLWNTSMKIGNASLILAQHFEMGKDFADDCYTAGLFHNAGMALIFSQTPQYPKILRQAYETNAIIGEFEEQELETSHEVLGFLIAQSWGLNSEISNVIAYHHSPNIMLATGEASEKKMFAILKLAEHMVNATEILTGVNPDPEWEKNITQLLDVLHLDDFQLLDLGVILYNAGIDNIYHV